MKSGCRSQTRWHLSQNLLNRLLSDYSQSAAISSQEGTRIVVYDTVKHVILGQMMTAVLAERFTST